MVSPVGTLSQPRLEGGWSMLELNRRPPLEHLLTLPFLRYTHRCHAHPEALGAHSARVHCRWADAQCLSVHSCEGAAAGGGPGVEGARERQEVESRFALSNGQEIVRVSQNGWK